MKSFNWWVKFGSMPAVYWTVLKLAALKSKVMRTKLCKVVSKMISNMTATFTDIVCFGLRAVMFRSILLSDNYINIYSSIKSCIIFFVESNRNLYYFIFDGRCIRSHGTVRLLIAIQMCISTFLAYCRFLSTYFTTLQKNLWIFATMTATGIYMSKFGYFEWFFVRDGNRGFFRCRCSIWCFAWNCWGRRLCTLVQHADGFSLRMGKFGIAYPSIQFRVGQHKSCSKQFDNYFGAYCKSDGKYRVCPRFESQRYIISEKRHQFERCISHSGLFS